MLTSGAPLGRGLVAGPCSVVHLKHAFASEVQWRVRLQRRSMPTAVEADAPWREKDVGLSCRAESGDFAGFAQHLVDFARVKLLGIDHLSGVFLDDD
jgi:hypothetical protein